MRIHLDARRTSTSSKKNNVPTFSPMHDKINKLRKRLDKLAAKRSEATPSTTSPQFSLEIQQAPLPTGFYMPTMTIYEGKTDPQDHLDAFNDQMDLLQVSSWARCRCFVVTLTTTAKKWFRQIEPETVASWTQLLGLFMRQFQWARKYATPMSRLASINQVLHETLKAYIRQFNEELATIHNPQENGVLMAAISGVPPETPFWDQLQNDECKTLQEFYRRVHKIMHLETTREVVQARRSTSAGAQRESAPTGKFEYDEKNGDNKKRKSGDCRRFPDVHQKKAKSQDQQVTKPPSSKYNNFTDLTRSHEDVFLDTEHT